MSCCQSDGSAGSRRRCHWLPPRRPERIRPNQQRQVAGQSPLLPRHPGVETDPQQPATLRLHFALERDYQALTYLLRNAATVNIGHYTTRERLLLMDFQLLRLAVRLQHALRWPGWQARLLEMSRILEYFGDTVGQRFEALAVSRQP
jgi:hypothetical protein